MTEPPDPLPWLQHELKVREFYDKRLLDAERTSSEFSKLMITNLILINAGGLGALPVISAFIGIGSLPWPQKFPLLVCPGALFVVGLVAALFCALLAYSNYGYIARTAEHDCKAQLSTLCKTHPGYLALSEEFKAFTEREYETGLRDAKRSRFAVRFSYVVAHGLGWISLGSFVSACYLLTRITPP